MSAVEDLITLRRSSWTTKPAARPVTFLPISRYTALEAHWSGTPIRPDQTVASHLEQGRKYHVDTLGWQDIWYQLAIHPTTGEVIELRGAGASNSIRPYLAVLLPGLKTTDKQFATLHQLRLAMVEEGASADLRYHAMRGGTICPGTETIDRIHRIWAVEQSTGVLVSDQSIDPEAHLAGQAQIAVADHPIVTVLRAFGIDGYATVHADGGVNAFGNFPYLGSIPEIADILGGPNPDPVVSAATSEQSLGLGFTDIGYTLVTKRGAVFNFGSAKYHGRVDIVGD